jgi:GT2 family glycosyltransferase
MTTISLNPSGFDAKMIRPPAGGGMPMDGRAQADAAALGPADPGTDISIVIVSWNARQYLRECLQSLRMATGKLSAEIIVVDNASSDGTADMVRSEFPEVQFIDTGNNLGFSCGNNLGVKLAKGKYICLVNPDVNVPPSCLPKMFSFMQQNPGIGLLGPKMLDADGIARRSGMRFPTLWGVLLRSLAADTWMKGRASSANWLMNDFQFDQLRDMDVLNGWFWMARREAVSHVGLLDVNFFMYGEDMDWCKRFHENGWRVVFYPEAEATHYGGGCSANDPLRFSVEQQRANLQYWKKYHGRISLLLYAVAVWLGHAVRLTGWSLIGLAKSSARTRARYEVKHNFECMRRTFDFPAKAPAEKLIGETNARVREG